MTEIILGPPGTGKTTTLLNLVDDELKKGVSPERIGYITFTKKGAYEAADRAKAKFGMSSDQLRYFRTIHSLCYKALALRNTDVLAGETLTAFAQYAGIRVTGRAWSDDGMLSGFFEGDRILFMENLSRLRQVTLREQYDSDDDGLDWNEVQRVATALADFKRGRGILDYTDMLLRFVKHNRDVGLQRLFVDESQDLSTLQWAVVRLLARSCERVVVAGDDDQAIFEWAGADVDQFVRMEGKATVLGQSWRVPLRVQEVANRIISGVGHRRSKTWKAKRGVEGVVEYLPMMEMAELDKTGTVLILGRNSYVFQRIEPELRARGIVYEIAGKSSIDVEMVEAAGTWEDLRAGKTITVASARSMYKYIAANTGIKRGFKKLEVYGDDEERHVSMSDLRGSGGLLIDGERPWHSALDRIPSGEMAYMRAARRHGERLRGRRPRIRLSTIHSVKGGEADHVVILKEMAARTFHAMTRKPDEERRVWYVGVTRAKQRLTIVESTNDRSCPWL